MFISHIAPLRIPLVKSQSQPRSITQPGTEKQAIVFNSAHESAGQLQHPNSAARVFHLSYFLEIF